MGNNCNISNISNKVFVFFLAVLILSLCSCKDKVGKHYERRQVEFTENLNNFYYEKTHSKWIKKFYREIAEAEGWKFYGQTWIIKETESLIAPYVATTDVTFYKEGKLRTGAPDSLRLNLSGSYEWIILGYESHEYDEDKEPKIKYLGYYYALEEQLLNITFPKDYIPLLKR